MKTWKEILGAAIAAGLTTALLSLLQSLSTYFPGIIEQGGPAACAYAAIRFLATHA